MTRTTYDEAKEFMEHAMPHNLRKLKLYDERGSAVYALPDRKPD